jgi:hypothetical protein
VRVYAMLWLSGLCLLVSACQLPSGQPAEKVPVYIEEPGSDESRALTDVLIYAQRTAQMNAEEHKRELSNWTQAMTREKGDRALLARLRVTLLLAQPGTALQDEARAQNVLEAYANVPASAGPLRQFAAFLHDQIAERVRTRQRADQLKEQVDALRAVERSIIERGQKPQPRKP